MAGYKVISFDKIASTQTYAHNLIARGAAGNCVAVIANAQTAGHGRYKRRWVSKPGNLYVSFIFNDTARNPRLSYAVAVAVAETLITLGAPATIKWPNDILIDGKKICGILIEYNNDFVVVGIGINITSCPDVEKYQTAKLADYCNASRADVMKCLMKNLDVWRGADFKAVRERWTELAAGLNGDVLYRGAPAKLIGINDDGALILRRDDVDVVVFGDEISL